jgi:tetratricopeptide (TPR) repeat protein
MAMFTKEIAITLPLMILLYEFSFLRIKKDFNWAYLIPFLLTLIIIPVTLLFTHNESINSQEIRGAMKGSLGISPMHYLLTQFRVMVTYIRLVFLPVNQNLDYDYPISKSILELPALISFLFLISILFSAKRLFSKYRLVSFAIFWFFLTLLPESSFFPIHDVIFEHRLYLPLVGYGMFLASSVYYLFCRHSEPEGRRIIRHLKTLRFAQDDIGLMMTMVVLTMIITCNSVLTYQRNKVWKDEITLLNDTIRKSPHKARPYGNRGSEYFKEGNFTQAMSDFNKAIELNPKDPEAYYNRGDVYKKQGNFTQAISDYNKAIELDPNYADAYTNRGVAYAKQNNFTQAMPDFTKAIELNPNLSAAYNNRAVVHYQLKEYDRAWGDLRKAEELGAVVNQGFISALKQASGRDK